MVSDQCFKYDASLVECIDIKKTLESRYIKLDRNSFSEEGHEYLEKAYQAVVELAREALKVFGRSDEGVEPKVISNMRTEFTTMVKEYENSRRGISWIEPLERRIEQYLLSISVFAYFATVDKKDEMFSSRNNFSMKSNNSERENWNALVKDAIKVMEKQVKLGYQYTSIFFKLHTHSYTKDVVRYDTSEGDKSILDVINLEKKYAIVSFRERTGHSWVDHLVELGSIHGEIKTLVLQLRTERELDKRDRYTMQLEKIGMAFVESIVNKPGVRITKYSEIDKEQRVVRWLLDNIPTMAVFSSFDETIRVNVLDMDVCGSVYLDIIMRKLTMERMVERYRNGEGNRVATRVWSGYRYLALDKIPESILFVKRGKMAVTGSGEMIFPLLASEQEALMSAVEQKTIRLSADIERLYGNIITVVKKQKNTSSEESSEEALNIDMVLNIYENYLRMRFERLFSDGEFSTGDISTEDVLKLYALDDQEEKYLVEKLIHINNMEQLVNLVDADEGMRLIFEKKILLILDKVCNLYSDFRSRDFIKDIFSSPTEKNLDNIIRHTEEHGVERPLVEPTEMLYLRYLYELQTALKIYYLRMDIGPSYLKDFAEYIFLDVDNEI